MNYLRRWNSAKSSSSSSLNVRFDNAAELKDANNTKRPNVIKKNLFNWIAIFYVC
jgi:hypothetical protein